jgi:hypothetical protein
VVIVAAVIELIMPSRRSNTVAITGTVIQKESRGL